MIRKIIRRIQLYRKLRFFQYLYLNHFCKSVIRTDRFHIFPYRNTVIEIDPTARIYLGGGDIELGCDQLKGSRAETRVRLRENAVWSNEGGCCISYGSTLEILPGAVLDSRFFTMNSDSTVIAAKRIQIGQDVMIGRGVIIYDSDHHSIRNGEGEVVNPDAPILIGDHVWLATHVTVLKGASIGNGSVIGANTAVHGAVEPNSMCQTDSTLKSRKNYGTWGREHPSLS